MGLYRISTEEDQFLSRHDPVEPPNLTFREKAKLAWENITVEPLLVAYIIPSAMSMLATQNLALEKACRINLNYSDEICDALSRRDTINYKTCVKPYIIILSSSLSV